MHEQHRKACEDLALAPGSEFSVVHRFLPENYRDQALVLEALFRSLRDIPYTVSDPSVGIAKISWWQRELLGAGGEGSQHPVVAALVETGGIDFLDPDRFNAYLHGLVESLQEEPVTDVSSLRDIVERSGGCEARMMVGGGLPETAAIAAGASARLLELLRTIARSGADPSWLPLDLVARHQVRAGEENPASRLALIADLAAEANRWRASAPVPVEACETPGARYLALRDALVGRRLGEAARHPERWVERSDRSSFGDVFTTWRRARAIGGSP